MLEFQRKLLENDEHTYLSIGITADGEPRRSISVPWDRTGNAYNMRTPTVYLAAGDLSDPAVWAMLDRFRINGCYIFCPLTDYSFLNRLTDLWDLRICKGAALKSVDFLAGMPDWFQLYLEDAVLPDLNALFPSGPRGGFHSYCVCLSGCTVGDISALEQEWVRLSELVILVPRGTAERERWKNVRCGKYTYYEYEGD